MKAKHLIMASLILAILTIGAVSASQDIATDDELAVNDEGIEIEEVSADDADAIADSKDSDTLEKSDDAEELGEYGFELYVNSTADLADDGAKVVNASVSPHTDYERAYIEVKKDDVEIYKYDWDFDSAPGHIELTLDDLNISSQGSYHIELFGLHKDNPQPDSVGSGTIEVKASLSISWLSEIDEREDDIAYVEYFPTNGTLEVYVDGTKRFNESVEEGDAIGVDVSDLNITFNGKYLVSAKFVTATNVTDLGQENITVEIEKWDDYVSVSSIIDIFEESDNVVGIYDDYSKVNGTLAIYIDGVLAYTDTYSGINIGEFIYVEDFLYDNATLGNHTVRAVYMKNGVEKHEVIKQVEFIATPNVILLYEMSVGEKENFVAYHLKSFNGTATLYNAVWDGDDGEWVSNGTVAGTANFVNGVARIPFGALDNGTHYFIVNITDWMPDDEDDALVEVEVNENDPKVSANVSASEITFGENVVLKISGTPSNYDVYLCLDDDDNLTHIKSDIGGSLNYTFANLTVGTHKIKVSMDDSEIFYSNSFYVTVKEVPAPTPTPTPTPAPAPAKKDTIKLTLKKVKVKKSAKKLVLKATLKINGKAVKGKVIKFKFNKKTYKAKTNKKGVAKVTIKKKVLKKLKVGKKVKIQATYGKTTKKLTVKVKK